MTVVEEAAHEARVVVAALLTVGDDVDTGADLRVDGEAHRVARRRLELVVTKPPLEMLVNGSEHPARPAPARSPRNPRGVSVPLHHAFFLHRPS